MDKEKEHNDIEEIASELRSGCLCRYVCEYLYVLADRIEAAHANEVVKAMNKLMGK